MLRIRNLSYFSTFAEQLFETRKQQLVYTLDFFFLFLLFSCKALSQGLQGLAVAQSAVIHSINHLNYRL